MHSGNLNYPRDPKLFLEAYAMFIHQNPDADMKVYFQGVQPVGLSDVIENLGLENYVKILHAVSYKECVQMLSKYKVVMIIEAACEEGIFLPTKVSDYMQEKKVIWAISPENGVLHDLYSEGYIGYFADCTTREDILKELNLLFLDFRAKRLKASKIPRAFLPNSIEEEFNSII